MTQQLYKDECDRVLLERCKSPENSVRVASKGDSSEMIRYNLLRLHYYARKDSGPDVTDHPFLTMEKPAK